MTDLAPVDAHNEGPNSLTQAATASELPQPVDKLAMELKSLRQQALTTQAAIQQLQLEQPDRPYANVLSELPIGLTLETALLGIGVLILSGIFWWTGTRRSRAISMKVGQEFVDSYCPPQTDHDLSPLADQEQRRLSMAALPEPLPILPTDTQFSILPPQDETNSGLDVDLDDLSSTMEPAAQPILSFPFSPVATHGRAPEFDPEAAAGEVQRVLKSLAKKRVARSRRPQKTHDPIPTQQGNGEMILPPVNAAENRQLVADQDGPDQTFARQQGEQTPSIEAADGLVEPARENDQSGFAVVTSAESLMDFNLEPIADLQNLAPSPPTTEQTQDVYLDLDLDLDHDVQLSLAQEFEALGLTLGARQLATEALASSNISLSSQAQALLHQIQAQEIIQPGIV